MGLGAVAGAVLSVKILVDASEAAKGMGEAASGVEGLQAKIGGLVAPAALVGGALVEMGSTAVSAASDSEQAMGGLEAVFGKSADQMKAWAGEAATAAGLSSTEYATAAALIGGQLKAAGIPMDDVVKKTDDMIGVAADLAATYGGTTADAVDALSAAFRGEYDSSEKYNVGLSANAVAAQMAADGTDKLTGAAYDAAKANATMEVITKNSADSMGQFAKQSGTAAEQQQIAAAQVKNMAAAMGEALLPAVSLVAGWMGTLAQFVTDNSTAFMVLAGVVAVAAGGILALSVALKAYQLIQGAVKVATTLWTAAQWLLNAALAANPVGLVIIAVVALVAAIALLWTKCEGFRTFITNMWNIIADAAETCWKAIVAAGQWCIGVLTGIWNGIKQVADTVWKAITGFVQSAMTKITAIVSAVAAPIAAVWNGIKQVASTVWNAITGFVSASMAKVSAAVSAIVGPINGVWNSIKGAATTAWNAIGDVVDTVVDGVKGAWESIVGVVSSVWGRVTSIISSALAPITGLIENIGSLWDSTVGRISSGIDQVTGWLGGLMDKIGNVAAKAIDLLPGGNMVQPGGYAIPASPTSAGLTSRAATPASSASSGPTINVYGALDADSVARQIAGILTGRQRRTAGVRVGGAAFA